MQSSLCTKAQVRHQLRATENPVAGASLQAVPRLLDVAVASSNKRIMTCIHLASMMRRHLFRARWPRTVLRHGGIKNGASCAERKLLV
jgi:hypothetical protein